jgi:hypothetical protein
MSPRSMQSRTVVGTFTAAGFLIQPAFLDSPGWKRYIMVKYSSLCTINIFAIPSSLLATKTEAAGGSLLASGQIFDRGRGDSVGL